MRALMRSVVLLFVLAGCSEGDVTRVDSRFSTPENTVQTLFGAYGVAELSQSEAQSRIAVRGAFEMQDEAAFRACFTDIDRPGGDGMAGYVFGVLVAGKDELVVETFDDHATVSPRPDIRVVLERGTDHAYRIVLGRSVPEAVQRGMLQVEENAQHRVPTTP